MQFTEDHSTEAGVQQVAAQLHGQLRRYLEAQYHIRDTGLIEERRTLLEEAGAISQLPYLESTPIYEYAEPYAKLGLPHPVGDVFTELAGWRPPVGVFERPYVHQAQALQAFLNAGKDLIIATGTGSGKTESFLFPILGRLLLEGAQRPRSFVMPGFRALLLYPMNALVSDQLARLRRLFGDERLARLFADRYGRIPRFGMYTSRTPYPGRRTSDRDQKHMRPILKYYVGLEQDNPSEDAETARTRETLVRELKTRGRWPAKDLVHFLGEDKSRWDQRLKTHPFDRELLMRQEMQSRCPDLLVTNYSMLEYMLLRPIERSIFKQTAEWLATDRRNSLILVLDEAHMYRGTAGAEVALLIRRLQARLGIPREQMRCILTSASLGSDAKAEQAVKEFAVGLTGHPVGVDMPFQLIRGTLAARPSARMATPQEASALAQFDLAALQSHAENLSAAEGAVDALADALHLPPRPTASMVGTNNEQISADEARQQQLRGYLFQNLSKFGPLDKLLSITAGRATPLAELTHELFPTSDEPEAAEAALEALLALGAFASDAGRTLFPARIHMFFRGLPSLYACVNPKCDQRRFRPGEELVLGRLYTEPRTHCTCKAHARVYELYTHRDCGAAFLRVFTRPDRSFYWHEQGGSVELVGEPLLEDFLLMEEPHPDAGKKGVMEPVWLELTTGRIESAPPPDAENYRLVYRPIRATATGDTDRPKGSQKRKGKGRAAANEANSIQFTSCPVCTKDVGKKIMDLSTKGEQPFANLVREQLICQTPTRAISKSYPNGGRKVLLFSDGRQKAARLARDLPREVESDSFRQVIALAAHRLTEVSPNGEAALNERLYTAFVAVCGDYYLHFFDQEDGSQGKLLEHIGKYRSIYGSDLSDAVDDAEWIAPNQYRELLLRQLTDSYYSLNAVCAAVVTPTKKAIKQLERLLPDLPATFRADHLQAVTTAWIQGMLERAAFDATLPGPSRERAGSYYKEVKASTVFVPLDLARGYGQLNDAQKQTLRDKLFEVFTDKDVEGYPYLSPSKLALQLALDDVWWQCRKCRLTQHQPLSGRCVHCGRDELTEMGPSHPYMVARKGYFREPIMAVLRGERPIHLVAEEHTAQLSQRDANETYATTEEFELRFQDVTLGPNKPPVDVLSCTTTMEVGIDIGSLTAVGLRNVPPQRENYQQRAGRSGRRGSAISTVVTYAQGGAHDNYYYHNPKQIISGDPRLPVVKVDNRRLAARHIYSFLLQTFFHEQLDRLEADGVDVSNIGRGNLLSTLGTAQAFFAGASGSFLDLNAFAFWVNACVLAPQSALLDTIAVWLPDEICSGAALTPERRRQEKSAFAAETAQTFLVALDQLASDYRGSQTKPAGSDSADTEQGQPQADAEDDDQESLIDQLFDQGLLPSYAFPTDLCTFFVFEKDGRQVRVKERPQQAKDKALSEYAPGRLLVVNKKTYRVGGIYVEGADPAAPAQGLFEKPLPLYTFCVACGYVGMDAEWSEGMKCPVCSEELRQAELLDPPGFSPEKGDAINESDREQEITYATSAQFPVPVDPDKFTWHDDLGPRLFYTFGENQRLVIANQGPEQKGFKICETCGATWPDDGAPVLSTHRRPYILPGYMYGKGISSSCSGKIHDVSLYLGYTFPTDLVLLRIPIFNPLAYDYRALPWFQDALRSAAEALSLAASRILDIDVGELSAGFRRMPPGLPGFESAKGVVDIYMFDTASGGAGYAAEAGGRIADVIDEAIRLLSDCPTNCERSCTKCMRHYGNRFWHDRLDRHLGAQFLNYARNGLAAPVAPIGKQAEQLTALRRYLELEGWSCTDRGTVGGVEVPLLVAAKQGVQAAVGVYPALLDRTLKEFEHPLNKLNSRSNIRVILLNDYVVARDLPTAYADFNAALNRAN